MPMYEEDEYEDYDEYEEEEEEGEEEEEHEQMPTKESKEYLELRERLKQRIRKGKESGSGVSKSPGMRKKSLDNYGSFFGPSEPVIAPRVIQESKSLLENPHLLLKTPNPLNNKKTSSNGRVPKNGTHEQIPKIRHELISKVQKIKDTRDYSFLLDDNAELPSAPPVSHNVSVSRSAPGTTSMPQKSRLPAGNSSRDIRNIREEGKAIPRNGHMHSKSEPHKSSSSMIRHSSTSADSRGKLQKTSSMDNRRQLQSKNSTGPGRPVESMDSRGKLQSKIASGPGRPVESVDSRRQSQSNNGNVRPGNGHVRPGVSVDRRQLQSNGNGLARPMGGPKHGSSLTNGEKKAYPPPSRKAILPPERKRLPSNIQSSTPRQEVERKRLLQSAPKHSVASSKTQISKPVKQLSSRPSIQDTRLKRKPSSSFDDESAEALRLIRQMTGADRYRNRYDEEEDDLSDMEANFDEILEEEDRSLRIAKEEDAKELRLIQQEEREEQMRRLAKKRKLNNHHR